MDCLEWRTLGSGRALIHTKGLEIVAYSSDGIAWTAIPAGTTAGTSTFGTSVIFAITYGNGRFVAVGYDGKMVYSSDGINWTAVGNSTF